MAIKRLPKTGIKIYADKGITHREFKVDDHVFLKVKAKRSSLKLGTIQSW
jgi:hypothetical protein